MSLFGNLMEKARSAGERASAQLTKADDLERIALAVAGAMAADGKFEDAEYNTAANVLEARFKGAFSRTQIEKALDKGVKAFEGSKFSGRRTVFAAMEAVENSDEGEAIFAAVLDVCDASGGIGDEEMTYIKTLGQKLRVSLSQYGL